uniref:Vacuolar protein sorting-associated protein 8 central domain-containing protein n=1 Tax=Aplanochytrium stocchinoi TaxID=215587 RepID=A0A6S7ZNG6_9STRA
MRDTFMVSIQPTGSEAKVTYVWHLKGKDEGKKGWLPSTSWSLARLGEGRACLYTLARGWGNEIQFLQSVNNEFIQAETFEVPVQYGTVVMALEWLQSSTLAILNEEYEFCVLDVVSMTMVEKISMKGLQLVWTSFSQSQHSFHSSFISKPVELRDGNSENLKRNALNENQTSLFLLGIKTLAIAKVQRWTQRVESLVSRGLWLQGLALALDQYELNGHRERNKMAEIILQYATSGNVGREEAGACIEFCLEIERTDVLFGTIYECFVNVGKHAEFLEVLEPYILNRLVAGMGPLVLKDFVEHYQSQGKILEVEECITHLDPATIRSDLDTLVKLSKKYSLWSALIYLFNTGLNDWESPIRILLKATNISSEVRVEMLLKAMDAVNTDDELWESQILSVVEQELPQNEAVTISSFRLEKRSIPGGVSKEMIGKVLTRLLIEGEQLRMVKVLNNCDICMYNVDEISTHLKAYGWNEALQTVYLNSLHAAINSGQSLQRIEHAYLQVISTCTDPVTFCHEQLSQSLDHSHLVREALRNAIVKSLKLLFRSSPDKACQLVSANEIITDATQLDDFPLLQYEYMKKREIQDHLLFIRLLAKLHPEQVYDYVSSNEGVYPLDETLHVCKKHNIKDATSYLLERTGDMDGALDTILECIDEMKNREHSFEHAVGVAIQMCERNSITNLDTDQSQKMWFRLLEKLILSSSSSESKDIGSDKDEPSIALRNVLHSMMVHVESKNILKLVRSKPFGVLKKTVKAMVDAKYLENNMLKMASRLIVHDMLHLVKAKHEKLNRSTTMTTVSTNSTGIVEENTTVIKKENEDSLLKEGLRRKSRKQTCWYTDWDEKLEFLGSTQLQLDPQF